MVTAKLCAVRRLDPGIRPVILLLPQPWAPSQLCADGDASFRVKDLLIDSCLHLGSLGRLPMGASGKTWPSSASIVILGRLDFGVQHAV